MQHAGRHRAHRHVGECGHAARAHVDHVDTRLPRALDDRFGDGPDEAMHGAGHAGGIEQIAARLQHRFAFVVVVLLHHFLADELAHVGHAR
jgi:hypothetical protein